jgi:NAD(P)-dependent dehydrogenase (short-subunit alcohol dehydrogenase family)
MSEKWITQDIPSQEGRTAIVTGANSGIGYETAKALAEKGATVVMACRNLDKANAAADKIRQEMPGAKLAVMQLDLADLASVRAFAKAFSAKYDKLDLLINNAGIMIPPFTKTKDGFEVQFGANHLGHFALTGLLLPLIQNTPGARVVNVSSDAHRMGRIDFDNLQSEKGYRPWAAYGQSKLANLLFTLSLNELLKETNTDAIAVASHPGTATTNLQAHSSVISLLTRFMAQSPEMGALPSLRAATAPDVQANDFYGPGGLAGMRGHPKKVQGSAAAKDAEVAKRLWEVSEALTGVHYGARQPVTA